MIKDIFDIKPIINECSAKEKTGQESKTRGEEIREKVKVEILVSLLNLPLPLPYTFSDPQMIQVACLCMDSILLMCFTKYGFQTSQQYCKIGCTKVLKAVETSSELFNAVSNPERY